MNKSKLDLRIIALTLILTYTIWGAMPVQALGGPTLSLLEGRFLVRGYKESNTSYYIAVTAGPSALHPNLHLAFLGVDLYPEDLDKLWLQRPYKTTTTSFDPALQAASGVIYLNETRKMGSNWVIEPTLNMRYILRHWGLTGTQLGYAGATHPAPGTTHVFHLTFQEPVDLQRIKVGVDALAPNANIHSWVDRGILIFEEPTPTATSTSTATHTPTSTHTFTPTSTRTFTPTSTRTFTPTSTPTHTVTQTATNTATATFTATYTPTPTATATHTATWTHSPTATPTHSATPTSTPTASATWTATVTNTATPTHTATRPPTDTLTPTLTATSTPTHTATSTDTATSTPTATHTNTPTRPPTLETVLPDNFCTPWMQVTLSAAYYFDPGVVFVTTVRNMDTECDFVGLPEYRTMVVRGYADLGNGPIQWQQIEIVVPEVPAGGVVGGQWNNPNSAWGQRILKWDMHALMYVFWVEWNGAQVSPTYMVADPDYVP